jgi:hypothetical protein
MSESEEINKILEEYKQKNGNKPITDNNGESPSPQSSMDIALLLSKTISSFTRIISPKVGLESIAFTKDDENNFYESLKPFNDQLMDFLKYMVYMPFIIFAVGYGLRIYVEYKEKHKYLNKEPKKNTPKESVIESSESNIKPQSEPEPKQESTSNNEISTEPQTVNNKENATMNENAKQ